MKWKSLRPSQFDNKFRKARMLLGFLALMLFTTNCGQDFNSNTFDAKAFGAGAVEADLAESFTILQDKCMSCHYYHQEWQSFRTSAAWVAAGRVVPGNSLASDLITRMKNVGGNMPIEGDSLSGDEFATVRAWIDAL